MNPDPDYSAAYVELHRRRRPRGPGLTFTIGRGNEMCVRRHRGARARSSSGRDLDEILADPGAFCRRVTGDAQLRWLGPEKGVIHLATAALVNAVWDLWAQAPRASRCGSCWPT